MGIVFSCLGSAVLLVGEAFSAAVVAVGEIFGILIRGFVGLIVAGCDLLAANLCCFRVPLDEKPNREGYTFGSMLTTKRFLSDTKKDGEEASTGKRCFSGIDTSKFSRKTFATSSRPLSRPEFMRRRKPAEAAEKPEEKPTEKPAEGEAPAEEAAPAEAAPAEPTPAEAAPAEAAPAEAAPAEAAPAEAAPASSRGWLDSYLPNGFLFSSEPAPAKPAEQAPAEEKKEEEQKPVKRAHSKILAKSNRKKPEEAPAPAPEAAAAA